LKELRTAAGLTQQALAHLVNERHGLGWYQSTVQKLEAGTREPSLSDLEALGDVFGMTLDAMVWGGNWPGVKTASEFPHADPIHEMQSMREGAVITGLRYERQFHVQRIAEIDAEIARLREPPPGFESVLDDGSKEN